jgi:mono/diheme cytochrome c family protein
VTALRKRVALIAVLAVLSSACSDAASSGGQTAPRIGDLGNAPAPPDLDSGSVEVGRGLYTERCASCHGADLAGDPDWKTPNPDGSYPPPPHDSTGHTWHHSDRLLVDIVRNGSGFEQSRMPTFSDLSVEQVLSIVEYLKTTWGPEERAFQWQVTWQETPSDD